MRSSPEHSGLDNGCRKRPCNIYPRINRYSTNAIALSITGIGAQSRKEYEGVPETVHSSAGPRTVSPDVKRKEAQKADATVKRSAHGGIPSISFAVGQRGNESDGCLSIYS